MKYIRFFNIDEKLTIFFSKKGVKGVHTTYISALKMFKQFPLNIYEMFNQFPLNIYEMFNLFPLNIYRNV